MIAAATSLPSAALAATSTSRPGGARRPAGRPAASAPRPAPGPPGKAIAAEIDAQKRSLAKLLETIRAFPLAAGSDPAFVFTPLKPVRRR